MAKRAVNASFGVDHKLGIDVVWDLPNDDQGRCYNFLGVEGWEGAQKFGRAIGERWGQYVRHTEWFTR